MPTPDSRLGSEQWLAGIVSDVDGVLACAEMDLASGSIVGVAGGAKGAPKGAMPGAFPHLLAVMRGPSLAQLAKALRQGLGDDGVSAAGPDELHLAWSGGHILVLFLPAQHRALTVLSAPGINIGMVWTRLRQARRELLETAPSG